MFELNLKCDAGFLYREAVKPSSPTLPLGGYIGYRRPKEEATPSGLRRIGIRSPQVAVAATPGLEVITASRYGIF
jgi:hypothetical protein